jgi:hypothetical protein
MECFGGNVTFLQKTILLIGLIIIETTFSIEMKVSKFHDWMMFAGVYICVLSIPNKKKEL